MTQTVENASAVQDFAQTYAEFAANLQFSALPEATVSAVTTNLIDTLACSLAGGKADGVPEVRDLVVDWGGKPEAQVLWSPIRVPAPQAAWVNGIMAHARDFDDTHESAIVHVGVSAVPAALAAAESAGVRVTGHDLFAGLVAGMELTTRMSVASTIGPVESGWMYTSLFGYFGATAAASRILGLSVDQTRHALGIVYSQAAGGHQVVRDGAWTKKMHPGFAARAALTSTAMSKRGVVGPHNVFEGADGLWKIYLNDRLDAEALRHDLGTKFHMEDLSYKPYPSCRFNHTAIDAVKIVRAQPGFDWRDVTEVRVFMNEQGRQTVGTPLHVRQNPATVTQAQFSICYNVACALINGTVGLADFDGPAALDRPEIARMAELVTPYVDPEIERDWGRAISPVRLEVVAGDRVFEARVDHATGSLEVPLTRADLNRKVVDCLTFGGFDSTKAASFEEAIENLVNSEDVASDLRRLNAAFSQR